MPATQEHRQIAVAAPVAGLTLLFGRMTAAEHLGRPFEFRLELLSDVPDINPTDVLGEGLTVSLALPDEGTRYFHGVITRFADVGPSGRYSRYEAVLRPWLWLLSRTADCRIFQNLTAPQIIEEVFRDNGFTDFDSGGLSGEYRTREYCVQYRESDFDFVSRLMEQEGIYYYFKHEEDKHTLMLADSVSPHEPAGGYEQIPYLPPGQQERPGTQYIRRWRLAQEIQSGTWVHTDYDFERPRAALETRSAVEREHTAAGMEVFDYPGDYVENDDGTSYAQVRIEELQAAFERVEGAGNARGLASGGLFTLTDYPRSDQNRAYLVVSATHELVSDDYEAWSAPSLDGAPAGGGSAPPYECTFTAIPSQQQYRPPRATPRPLVKGPQTAVVVGPDNQEIWTDQYGRVKVRFHWDRSEQADEDRTCWIRVAQVWAGKKWGGMYLPRIGQEVIVDFLEGDPDRPIITGRVYNADQMPPYTLPDNKTQTVFKTRSSADGTEETFNELRFEDLKDEEHVYFHAEKDFERVVENNDVLKVGFEKHDPGDRTVSIHNNDSLTVGNQDSDDGSQTILIWNNRTESVKEGNETVTIEKGDRTVTVDEGNDLHQVKQGNRTVLVDEGNDLHEVGQGNRTVKVNQGNDTHEIGQGNRVVKIDQGNDTLTVSQGNQTVKVTAGKCTIEAGQSIELKVGGSSIKIEPAKITLKSVQIAVEADGTVDVKGPMATVNGDGVLTLSGGLVKIN